MCANQEKKLKKKREKSKNLQVLHFSLFTILFSLVYRAHGAEIVKQGCVITGIAGIIIKNSPKMFK
jgi:hypothetical protein